LGLLATAIRKAVTEANETTTSAARKAELEAWLERYGTDISSHIHVSTKMLSKSRQVLEWQFGNSTAMKEVAVKWLARERVSTILRDRLTGRAEAGKVC
jgi:hypothetical protein